MTTTATGPSIRVDVYKLQCALRKEIPGSLTVDGSWGPQTKATLDTWISAQPQSSSVWYSTPARGATTITISTDIGVALFTPLAAGECARPRTAPPTPPTLAPDAMPIGPPPVVAPPSPAPPKSTAAPSSRWAWWLAAGVAVVAVGSALYYTRRSRR